MFMRELSQEEKILIDENFVHKQSIDDWKRKSYINKYKIVQEWLESASSVAFTMTRAVITFIICFIFLTVDWRMLIYLDKADITTLTTPENLKIIKYGFLFLASQLVIFSQGFGFSSIVKLIERFSSKKNAKEVKEAGRVENK